MVYGVCACVCVCVCVCMCVCVSHKLVMRSELLALQSNDGVTPILNEHGCPLLDLTTTIFATFGVNIQRAVSVCHASCCFRETDIVENFEQQEITFEHVLCVVIISN